MITIYVGMLSAMLVLAFGGIFGLEAAVIIAIFLIAVTAVLAILPIEGYHTTEETVTELIELRRYTQGGKTYYVQKTGDLVTYAFDNSEKYSLNGGAYEENCISKNVKVYESRKCTTPVLKKVVTRPIRNVYTISELFTKVEYVLYVPQGKVLYVRKNMPKKK